MIVIILNYLENFFNDTTLIKSEFYDFKIVEFYECEVCSK